mmetsp:Transcript_4923/g.13009  ORF Transcript_4923/g.13009 Transcript_4923/m.13009 type:complete len:177 (-) Transcript_4923:84-614(-)
MSSSRGISRSVALLDQWEAPYRCVDAVVIEAALLPKYCMVAAGSTRCVVQEARAMVPMCVTSTDSTSYACRLLVVRHSLKRVESADDAGVKHANRSRNRNHNRSSRKADAADTTDKGNKVSNSVWAPPSCAEQFFSLRAVLAQILVHEGDGGRSHRSHPPCLVSLVVVSCCTQSLH